MMIYNFFRDLRRHYSNKYKELSENLILDDMNLYEMAHKRQAKCLEQVKPFDKKTSKAKPALQLLHKSDLFLAHFKAMSQLRKEKENFTAQSSPRNDQENKF